MLKDLFKKDKLSNIYSQFLSEILKNFKEQEIPKYIRKLLRGNIILEKDKVLGKIKYDDKILHKSRVVKHFTEKETPLKNPKDLNNVYKKLKEIKTTFFLQKI